MKLLLTSAGVKNPTILTALIEMLGKPTTECSALCITTASYGHPMAGPPRAWEFIAGQGETPMVELGWKSLGVLEPTALPSLPREQWLPYVEAADVFLVNGGDTLFLAHWMRESGLAELLPTLDCTWVGLSAGSMVMTPRIGKEFAIWQQPSGTDEALGFVDFAIFPHLGHPSLPKNTMETAEKWAAKLDCPAYAIDDQTAIRVVDGVVDVLSEGTWHYLER